MCPTITSFGTPAFLNSMSVATIAARSLGGKCWWIAGDHVVKLPLVIVFTTWTIAWWSAATKPGISAMSAPPAVLERRWRTQFLMTSGGRPPASMTRVAAMIRRDGVTKCMIAALCLHYRLS